MSEAINRALREALDRPEPMMLIGQDIGPYGGTFGVTRGLSEAYGEETIRDAPLCESGTVGYAIGLAITGVRAVCEIEFFDFVGVAMDQIFNQAAKLHYFTGGKLTVPLVIRTPIVSRMGMGPAALAEPRVVVHAHPRDQDRGPVERRRRVRPHAQRARRLEPGPLRRERPPLRAPGRGGDRRASRSRSAAPGSRGRGRTPPSWPFRAWSTRPSRQRTGSRSSGISVEVIDPRTLAPLDMETILGSLRKTMRLAVAHDAHRTLGFGAEIAARCMEEAFDYLDAPVERVACKDLPIPCTPSGIEAVYPGADDVVAAVERLVA